MTTENSIRISKKDEIYRLLEEHSPSELDELFQSFVLNLMFVIPHVLFGVWSI